MIADSGNRTEYESGAVRDLKEGKGRCDLMPLDVVSKFMDDEIIAGMYNFQQSKDTWFLYGILELFYDKTSYASKPDMVLDVSIHYEEGAKKYGEYNWQKGIPIQSYIDSATRHYLKVLRGDIDENHCRSFVWNVLCLIWTVEHKEELGIE